MELELRLFGSLTSFEGSLLPGFLAEVSLKNYPFLTWFDLFGLRYLGVNTLGVSWNYKDTLARMPFPGQLIVYLHGGGGYYAPAPSASGHRKK
jgi:hypothetical protein